MNTPRRLFRSLVIGHSTLLIPATLLFADDASLRPIAFQNGIHQQALSTETAEIARAITELIDELQRNGFPIQSLSALTELSAQLNALGGTEMSAIATRLRRLGESAQADPRATATEAYVAQQAIENRLKALARQISIQQLREETARRLEHLITRQLAIQRETRAIASAKADAERQRILESDQAGIGEDLTTFFQTGDNLMARLRENDAKPAQPVASEATPAAAGTTFSERINGAHLTTLSAEAVEGLKGKRYPEAYARQDALVAELRKILQGILSSLPKEQRLANALQEVSALRQQEEANQQSAKKPTEESAQAAADQAQNLANRVAAVSPEAADALRKAQDALRNPQNNQRLPSPQGGNQQQQQGQQQAGNQQQQQGQQQNQNGQQQAQSGQQNQQNQQGQQQQGQQQAGNQQQQQGQQQQNQNGQQQAQSGQQNQQGQQNRQGQQQQGQPQGQSAAAAALAAAEAALRRELAQTQQQNAQGQQSGQQGQQQAGNQPNGQQQQAGQGQQQASQGQQQGQQQQGGQSPGQPSDLTGQDGQSPGESVGGTGGTQRQIAGHGPDSGDPAQVVGALRREEREAFTALQGERYPAEYSAWVQQYWRNLAQDQ